jgi:cytochrome c oxidase assembly factor CtaG
MPAVRALLLALILLGGEPAFAHVTPDVFASGVTWTYDPWLVTPLYLTGIAFFLGSRNIWRAAGAGRGLKFKQVAAFWIAWIVLALALVSPLHWLGERLFAAHMVEHEILMLIAAPLFALARPSGAIVWSLPPRARPAVGTFMRSAPVLAIWAVTGHPFIATLLHGSALWLWHAPALYTLALSNEAVHRLEHLSFFFTGLLFWWTLLHGRGAGRGERIRDAIGIGCLFLTVLHSGVLGALLTLSTHVWYPAQVQFSADFGLSPLEDQQLAGVLMWVPMGLVYTGAALYFAYRLLTTSQRLRPAPSM